MQGRELTTPGTEAEVRMKWGLTLVSVVVLLLSSVVDGELGGIGEWQILTKQNFSSQIRLNPHILLLVTVPWCGESRSLMKEVAHLVHNRQEEFGSLKLMFMYRNAEKMLSGAIGAAEGITVSYYHHSVSYKYRGKLRAQSILSSVYTYMSFSPEELPLRHLNSQEDLKTFVESTDKTLLLLEFCGWTPRLLANANNNGTKTNIAVQGNLSRRSFMEGTDGMLLPGGKDKLKGAEHGKMMCGIENGLSGIPWLEKFSSVNDSIPFGEIDKTKPGVEMTCTFEDFQQFDSFFSKFVTVLRDFFLPPERYRFGLVTERSLLSSLGVENSDSWSAMLHFTGCPSCSKILKEADDLKSALQMDNLIVTELEGDGYDLEPALPAKKPSMILFVDRSCDSSETRKKSNEALDSFREVAAICRASVQIVSQSSDQSKRSSVQAYQELTSASGHPRLKVSSAAQNIKLNDKMSIMVINEGKRVTLDAIASDLQGSSLHEMLTYLLQRKKEKRLSSLAKDVGFRLLSDDLEVKMSDILSSETEVQSNQDSQPPSKDCISNVDSTSSAEHDSGTKPTAHEPSSQYDKEEKFSPYTDKQLFVNADKLELTIAEDVKVEERSSSQEGSGDKQLCNFKGSFFFSDGNYRLLKALTGQSTIPSLVAIDPTAQQHYVLPEEMNFSYSSLADFLHGFLNGSLLPYQQSESVPRSPKDARPPPFVNLDFHEMDSIPSVTTKTFSKLVLGFNQSDVENASHGWNEDVLVLFSSSWCGFCQKMELVVREVYRAIKGYMKTLNSRSRSDQTVVGAEHLTHGNTKYPSIYLMDCTLNDCSLILKSINQREVYPTLMLFPAEIKEAIFYEGDISVADIIKFIAHHGSNSHHLIRKKGILWTVTGKNSKNQELLESSPSGIREKVTASGKSHEILLKSKVAEAVVKYDIVNSRTSRGFSEMASHVIVGSVLTATDKLLSVHPFDKSMIIIVKADKDSGFQGLIFNKHITWDSLHELRAGLEFLKEAPLSFGGPLIKHGMPLVGLTRVINSQYPQVVPGVCFLDQSATIHEIEELKSGNQVISDYWFFLGHSGWGWNQLFDEIDEGAWTVTDDHMGLLTWP